MPIQPMNVAKYNPVPEVEDVTPLDKSIAKKEQKSFKAVAVVFGSIVIVSGLAFFGWRFSTTWRGSVQVFQTSQDTGDRFAPLGLNDFSSRGFNLNDLAFGNTHDRATSAKMHIDSSKQYQEIIGFGGAFTEAAAYNFFKLPEKVREKVIKLYYGEDSIGYTLGRVHINSCDFSLSSYSFDEIDGDYSLQYFDTEVTHDNAQMIPFIRKAMEAAKANGKTRAMKPVPNGVNLLASPWSPPAWMKVGKASMTHSSVPNGLIDDHKVKSAWALYFAKWIEAYARMGAPIWAVTPQNEPEFPAPWEACSYNASYESHFINKYLGPTLEQYHPEVLILAFDHNKDHLYNWTTAIIGGDEGNYVDGMAFHWYTGNNDRLMDGTYGYEAVNASHYFAPNKILLASEGCSCPGVSIDNWIRAERLGHDLIFDLNNWAQGWIDWNLIVDSEGGPNHLKNNCDAPIVTLPDFSDIHVQPKYYYFGHITKYVTPGSVRVSSSIVGDYGFADIDPNVRAGMELGVFACEKSTRQTWYVNSEGFLQLRKLAIDTEATDGYMAPLCAVNGDADRPFLHIGICDAYKKFNVSAPIQFESKSTGALVDKKTGLCVQLASDVREPGAIINLGICRTNAADGESAVDEQSFQVLGTGEVRSKVQDMCVTAGWPMLSAAAFQDPSGQVVAVITNEASVDSSITIADKVKGDLHIGINARAIQTVIY